MLLVGGCSAEVSTTVREAQAPGGMSSLGRFEIILDELEISRADSAALLAAESFCLEGWSPNFDGAYPWVYFAWPFACLLGVDLAGALRIETATTLDDETWEIPEDVDLPVPTSVEERTVSTYCMAKVTSPPPELVDAEGGVLVMDPA